MVDVIIENEMEINNHKFIFLIMIIKSAVISIIAEHLIRLSFDFSWVILSYYYGIRNIRWRVSECEKKKLK